MRKHFSYFFNIYVDWNKTVQVLIRNLIVSKGRPSTCWFLVLFLFFALLIDDLLFENLHFEIYPQESYHV